MKTGFAAVRIGIVMFVIPFVFAMYPEILLIEQAVLDPNGTGEKSYLPGYDGSIDIAALSWVLVRLFFALVLLASALARFDQQPLKYWEWVARIVVAAAIMSGNPMIHGAAIVAGIGLIFYHRMQSRSTDEGDSIARSTE